MTFLTEGAFSDTPTVRTIELVRGQIVPVPSITRLEAYGNYTWIYQLDKPPFLSSKTLKHYEQLLNEFVRVHKAHLLNPNYIQILDCHLDNSVQKGSRVAMTTGEFIPWSRKRLYKHRRANFAKSI
ncbi:LytTr DNA-binding domain-containing protein [Spirosoma oryzae]|uniref:LytTr DNA-binding domain-containing protein n=1 Tax=Spirosoma oryzae TaxID=1469603 RepID=A0A2T0S2Z6_9BACT|nr:LytTR family DNA-binding domain-containing protein [Spirosoma oryzae]PRY27791.1 LytTr DNA-binding domain-containing protein [Spirosoma oryzae]